MDLNDIEEQIRLVRAFREVERWRVKTLREEHFGLPERMPPPPKTIPNELLDRFSMDGVASIRYRYKDSTFPKNHALIYSKEEVDCYISRIENNEEYYSGMTDTFLNSALHEAAPKNESIAILGSRCPWFEAMCLVHGAKPTTIDYNKIVSRDKRIVTKTVEEFNTKPESFNYAISISSIEHSGLGRYGDALDPDGDIESMKWLKTVVRKGGVLFLSVPVSRDEVCFNDYRQYGPARLPKLINGWRLIKIIGWEGSDFSDPILRKAEPLFVLRNE